MLCSVDGRGTVLAPWCTLQVITRASPVPQTQTKTDVNPDPSTVNSQPSTLDPQPSTLNPKPSTLNPQPLTLNPQPSPSTLHLQTFKPSNLSPQPST